ncbi:MAG: hypothetical protein ABIG61_08590 [Planctomycetota bacterium]
MKLNIWMGVIVLVAAVTSVMGEVGLLQFDFDDADEVRTATGYKSVTVNTVYDPNLGYGFVVAGADPLSDVYQSLWVVGDDKRYADAVMTNNWGDYFRVDVDPDKDYRITFAAGVPGWSCWSQAIIGGTYYGWADNPAGADTETTHPGTVKVIDVLNRDGGLNPPGQPRLRKIVARNSTEDPNTTTAGENRYGSYDNIRVCGWNNPEEYYGLGYHYNDEHRSEFLYIDEVIVTSGQILYDGVNDKYYIKIETYPGDSYGVGFVMLTVMDTSYVPPEPHFVELKFDFDDADHVMTATDYTSVTLNDLYDPNAGYGFVVGGADPLSDRHDSTWVVSDDLRYADCIFTGNWGDYFRVDVQMGKDYYVTFAAGNPGYSCWSQATIGGTYYGWTTDSAGADTETTHPGTIKVIDMLNLDGGLNPVGQPRLRKIVAKNSTEEPNSTTAGEIKYGSYNSIRSFGWNNTSDYFGRGWYYDDLHRSEFLYIDQALVTSEQLGYDSENDRFYIVVETYPGDNYGVGYVMLEIIQAAPTTCNEVKEMGLELEGDINGDCDVDLADFAGIAIEWLSCNNPEDVNCIPNW